MSEFLHGCGDGFLAGLAVRHITFQKQASAPFRRDLPRGFAGVLVLFEIGDRHIRALACEG